MIGANQSDAMFWMSLGDLVEQFEIVTINYCDPTYSRMIIPAEPESDAII